MNDEGQSNQSRGSKKRQDAIDPNGPETVQWMKIDTASVGVKNWSGHQMVDIY